MLKNAVFTGFLSIKMSQRTNTIIVSILCDIVGADEGTRTPTRMR
jgi:hypothetical protein